MNKIYKVIWSKVRNCYVAVSEIAKRNGKGTLRSEKTAASVSQLKGTTSVALLHRGVAAAIVSACALGMATPAYALPVLDAKDAAVNIAKPDAVTMNITSGAANNVIKWVDFSVAGGANRETVSFDTKNYLNYVTGNARSDIYGTLTGGGNIYLVNPNGVLFGDGAQVNVGNLYVSTRSLTADQLSAFTASGANPLTSGDIMGDVVNLGKLNATNITVEGKNITFKNVADVTRDGTLSGGVITGGTQNSNVTLTANGGEIHIGSADASTPAYTMSGTNKKYMYKLVSTADDLQNMKDDLNYMLANTIDMDGVGFTPLCEGGTTMFIGKFDGLNYEIQNLTINLPNADYVGLFGQVGQATIENVRLTGGTINGREYVGSVAGYATDSIIRNVYHTGTVTSSGKSIGGIVGWVNYGTVIENVYNTGTVSGSSKVGGIVGYSESGNNQIRNAYNTGNVTATSVSTTLDGVGGIAGVNIGAIDNAYNTGKVTGYNNVGGIAGENYARYRNSGQMSHVYNTGEIVGNGEAKNIGGIVGLNYLFNIPYAKVSYAYNSGNVSGNNYVGGIVGQNSDYVDHAYNAGEVSGTSNFNGIIGGLGFSDSPAATDSHTGTVEEIAALKPFSAWSVDTNGTNATAAWRQYGDNLPLLTAFLTRKDNVKSLTEYNGTNTVGATYSASTYSDAIEQLGGANYVKDVALVTPKDLTVSFGDISKTYDGTTDATAGTSTLDGIVNSDAVSLADGVTATYADKNAGTGKIVNYTGIMLTGEKAANYNLTNAADATGTGTITPKTLNVTFADISKVYDGTTKATAGAGTLAAGDIISGDTVTLDATNITAAYADKNVGAGNKTVNYSGIALSGADANNYSIAATAQNTTSTITPKTLNVTFADISKVYDGTTKATAGAGTLAAGDIISGDTVTLDATNITAAYADKNVGAGNKTVNYSGIALTGADANNYTIAATATGNGTITPKALTVAFADTNKTYDGNKTANAGVAMFSSSYIISGDDVKLDTTNLTAEYTDKNVGTANKTVKYSGIALNGTDAGNYSINATYQNTNSTIWPKVLTANFDNISKTYDGGVVATENGKTLVGVVSGDTVEFATGITGTFADKNVGTDKDITYSGFVLTGDDANNYSIAATASGKGTITQKAITVTFADISKVYDGTTNAAAGAGSLAAGDIISGDDVTLDATNITAAYADKNVGAGNKTVNYSGIALTGADANNYTIAATPTGNGTITPKAITATFADISKVYDGTTNATAGEGTLSGVVASDEGKVNVTGTATYDEKNAGSRTVNYTGVTLSGAEANNYSIATTATGNGTITRKALELVADSVSIQEGDATPTTFTGSIKGFVAGEGLGSGDTLLFALADPSVTAAGSYAVNGTLNGSASGEYGLNYTFSNVVSNNTAFVIVAKPSSIAELKISDLVPGLRRTETGEIKVTEWTDTAAQATPEVTKQSIDFAVAQTQLRIDKSNGSVVENTGMKQPPAMTAQEVAEQVHAQQEKNGAVKAVMDVVQQTDNAVGTEESKRKKNGGEEE